MCQDQISVCHPSICISVLRKSSCVCVCVLQGDWIMMGVYSAQRNWQWRNMASIVASLYVCHLKSVAPVCCPALSLDHDNGLFIFTHPILNWCAEQKNVCVCVYVCTIHIILKPHALQNCVLQCASVKINHLMIQLQWSGPVGVEMSLFLQIFPLTCVQSKVTHSVNRCDFN